MRVLRVKNHDKYQHYKTRNPPWIKLYRSVLTDYELRQVPVLARLTFLYLTILASETDNKIPEDLKYLSERFGYPVKKEVLTPLIDKGFVLASSASDLLASRASVSSLSLSSSESSPDLLSKKHSSENGRDYAGEARQILAFLNDKTGKKFRDIDTNLDFIIARLKSGVELQTCKSLIARKVRDWLTDPKMAYCLRPETLFNKTKFESYLAEVTK